MNKEELVVLVVDDEIDLCKGLSSELEAEGFQTVIAHSVKEALEVMENQKVDIVLSDVRMPEESGLSLLEKTKTPVILMSGYSDLGKGEAKDKGAVSLLEKPFNIKRIIELIESISSLI